MTSADVTAQYDAAVEMVDPAWHGRTLVTVQRLRLAAVCVGLTLLVFCQSSGYEAADTKLDLVVAPLRFLARALRLWDHTAAAGQLQDQAYGYLFPIGPFFVVGKLMALPAWVTQRSWESLLLIAAFLGVVRLSRLLGVAGFWPRVGAGLSYALAPRMLMELGVISSELMPVAALPWVLIPLVRASQHGSPRRAAAWSGVAFLFAGGVNAAATLAILPVPALWLITRSAGRRRRALMSWWALAIVLASAWWAVPLVALGRYSPPFLDWIESSAVTTGHTGLLAALRGTDHWQAYLGPGVWPAGWTLVAAPAAIVATTAVAALGLVGITRRATPHRIFLLACLLLGLTLVTLGHVATVGPPFAGTVRVLLDGALNAFRNIHKFDPVVRLPLAIGLGHALAALAQRVPKRSTIYAGGLSTTLHVRTLSLVGLVGVAAVAITPALSGKIIPQTRVANDPSWWVQTGRWLGQHEAVGRALVVPGAAQPVYVWGRPRDDALQPVADGPWTVRDVAPLAQPGYVRLLNSIEAALAAGRDDRSLAEVLARAGIQYVVVRNDLDTKASHATPLPFVHATLAHSPGFEAVAQFGPQVTSHDPNRLVDRGLTGDDRTIEIYLNTAWRSQAALLPAKDMVVANGSSDELPSLVAAGLAPRSPVVFGSVPSSLTEAGVRTTTVLTDGLRRREFGFGGISAYSATLTATQPFSVARAAHDYLPSKAGSLSTASYDGVSDVRASSSAADATDVLYKSAANSPWAAVDDDPATYWLSGSLRGAVGQWLQVDLARSVEVPAIQVSFWPDEGNFPSRVRLTTDTGFRDVDVAPASQLQSVELPPGRTQLIRLTFLAMADETRGGRAGISTMLIPAVHPSRTLVVPDTTRPDLITFTVANGERSACLTAVSGSAACDPSWAAQGEEDSAIDRTFTLAAEAPYVPSATVRLLPGSRLNALLDAENPIHTSASSLDSSDPRERAGAAVDSDASTGWVAAEGDRTPTISLALDRPAHVRGLTLAPLGNAPVTAPTEVAIRAAAARIVAKVPASGRIDFPRTVKAQAISITVLKSTLRTSTDSLTGEAHLLPVGLGEIRLRGDDVPITKVQNSLVIDCRHGLDLHADGVTIPLQLTASVADVMAGRVVPAQACEASARDLGPGVHRVRLAANDLARPQSISFRRLGSTALGNAEATPGGKLSVQTWSATDRTLQVSTTDAAFLAVRENANSGWRATLNGASLPAITLDGWQQGWLVPAGVTGIIRLDFTPQHSLVWGLVFGVLSVVAVILMAVLPSRRRAQTPLTTIQLGDGWMVAIGTLALVMLGGIAGLVVTMVIIAASWLAGRFGRRLPLLLAPAALLLAGLIEALAPAGSTHSLSSSSGVQIICLLALGILVLGRLRLGAPRVRETAQQRTLDEMPRQAGDDGRADGGEQEQLGEVAAEGAPTQPALNSKQ